MVWEKGKEQAWVYREKERQQELSLLSVSPRVDWSCLSADAGRLKATLAVRLPSDFTSERARRVFGASVKYILSSYTVSFNGHRYNIR